MLDGTASGRQYLLNPTPTHELIAKLNPAMTVETMNEMHKIEATLIENTETKKHGLGFMNEKSWQDLSTQLKELGLIEKAIPGKEIYFSN